tara:strand:- start:259 stop:720 length:462 start_codon:yes stop_codon:yes gene_type:complete
MPGLEDLYKEIILDHYRNPRNKGSLETPPAIMAEGFNPLCGDEVKVFVLLDNDLIQEIRIDGQGCSISQSSASMMTQALLGKTLEEAKQTSERFKEMMSIHEKNLESSSETMKQTEMPLGDLEALQGVVNFPVRIKCATLGWNTFNQIVEEKI